VKASCITEARFQWRSPETEKGHDGILVSLDGTKISTVNSLNWLHNASLERAVSSHWFL